MSSAADFLPERVTLSSLRRAAAGCRGCSLWKCGTRTVFGEGPARARMILVGEQPGDEEDRAGRPFVGPSGRLLDKALEAAEIDRDNVYLTNAVKHFKWTREPGEKKRRHKTPSADDVRACFSWLDEEIRVVDPRLVVCLGATAAKALLGPAFSVMRERGRPIEMAHGPMAIATVHPSAVLRAPSHRRAMATQAFIDDLRAARAALRST